MEILQTIWNTLITEDKVIINILSVPCTFLEVLLMMLIFTTILKIKCNKKQQLSYVIIFSIISILSNLLLPPLYCNFINMILLPILVLTIFKTSILKAILAQFLLYILAFILGTPLMLLFTYIFKISSDYFTNIPIYRLLYSIIFYALLYLAYVILSKKKLSINIFEKLKSKDNFTLILNFITGFIAICMQLYIEFYYIDYIPNVLVFTSLIILLIYFSISLFTLIRTSKLEATTQNLEEEKLYNKTLGILYDNIRCFKHDYNNTVQAIGGYISTNNMEGLKSYYNDLLDDCQKVNNLSLLNPEIINNPAIYSLLTDKYYKADELGIKINLDVFADLSTLNIKPYNLTKILGILLDNAVEASSKCENKIINITFRKDLKVNRNLIIIKNTYINKDVNTDMIFEKGYSSKTNEDNKNHGLGLWEVRKILKKSKNLNLFTTKDLEFFKQQLEIYN